MMEKKGIVSIFIVPSGQVREGMKIKVASEGRKFHFKSVKTDLKTFDR